MNKQRRKTLSEAREYLERASDLVLAASLDESLAYSSLPDGLQSSRRGEEIEAACDSLSDAADAIVEAIQCITEAIA